MRRIFRSKPFGADARFLAEASQIMDIVLSALRHDYSKVVSEALRVTGSFVNTLRAADTATIDKKHAILVAPIHDAVTEKLRKVDIDQDVKSNSIVAAANLVSSCHSVLTMVQVDAIINIFAERL